VGGEGKGEKEEGWKRRERDAQREGKGEKRKGGEGREGKGRSEH
jgi:hypothetical protein